MPSSGESSSSAQRCSSATAPHRSPALSCHDRLGVRQRLWREARHARKIQAIVANSATGGARTQTPAEVQAVAGGVRRRAGRPG